MRKRRNPFTGAVALILILAVSTAVPALGESAPEAEAQSPRSAEPSQTATLERPNHRFFNVRLTAGADFALGDALDSRGLGKVGGQGALGIDWVIVDPLAFSILVGYNAFASGDEGALQDLFATVGFRLRLFADKKGALNQPGGNAAGHLFIDAHFGYHSYENQEHAGYNVGLGYELSLAKDFNLGPFVRFAHTPIGDGFEYYAISFGIQASVGGKFKPDDADNDNIEDDDDKCPLAPEDNDNFEDDDGCPDEDNDNDGVLDKEDKCPEVAGVASNRGCAENDNDKDDVLNADDECPDDAEDMDGFEDGDGCPDNDNDNDGLADEKDKCPLAAEDSDGFNDEDGCPDADNDEDGIPDLKDRCPMIPETKNDVEDTDGCPDFVRLEGDRIELKDKVAFGKAKAEIIEGSVPMLEEVAVLMTLNPAMTIRIEAHTHNAGGKQKNQKTSERRAENVKAFLVSRGVDDGRIEAVGKGQDHPIADNKTKEGRAQNERVEIHITGPTAPRQEGDNQESSTPDETPPPSEASPPDVNNE